MRHTQKLDNSILYNVHLVLAYLKGPFLRFQIARVCDLCAISTRELQKYFLTHPHDLRVICYEHGICSHKIVASLHRPLKMALKIAAKGACVNDPLTWSNQSLNCLFLTLVLGLTS